MKAEKLKNQRLTSNKGLHAVPAQGSRQKGKKQEGRILHWLFCQKPTPVKTNSIHHFLKAIHKCLLKVPPLTVVALRSKLLKHELGKYI